MTHPEPLQDEEARKERLKKFANVISENCPDEMTPPELANILAFTLFTYVDVDILAASRTYNLMQQAYAGYCTDEIMKRQKGKMN